MSLNFRLFIITSILVLSFSCNTENKTGYVNITEVYRKIDISIEYRDKLSTIESSITSKLQIEDKELDDLKNGISINTKNQKLLSLVFKKQTQIDSLEKLLSKSLKDSTIKYNKLIEQKVNKLIYQYGKSNNFDYIYSPANTNAFMYADSTLEITDPIIEYINNH